jgi:quinol monooxygenase YgiN
MIVVYAKSNVKEENAEKFLELAKKLVEETRKEKGNVSYELIRGLEDRTAFAFLEKWESPEILAAHMKTQHFTSLVPKLGELREGSPDIITYEILV